MSHKLGEEGCLIRSAKQITTWRFCAQQTGLNITELVRLKPAFTKGKPQLSPKELKESRELARIRIHVERMIRMVKQKYSMLEDILPIKFIMNDNDSDITVTDKLMVVCCALVNLCQSVVPTE